MLKIKRFFTKNIFLNFQNMTTQTTKLEDNDMLDIVNQIINEKQIEW